VIDAEGVVLGDSENDPATMENHGLRTEIVRALKGGVGRRKRYSTTVKADMLYVAIPLRENGEIRAVVRSSLYLADIDAFLRRLEKRIFLVSLALIAFSGVIAFIISRRLSRPIRELSAASHRVASGEFDTRVFLKRSDELAELADSFNYMTGQTQHLFTQLSSRKDQLSAIISSIDEGLLVLDAKGTIVLCNESFQKIVRAEDVDGKPYWETFRGPEFDEFIKEIGRKKKSTSLSLGLYDRSYLLSGTYLESRGEIVVVFHDITELKNIQRVKRDFVTNVSHELRTPLTAIKGFIETLEEGIQDDRRRYLEIMRRHTDRLTNIVQDLLALSRLEEEGARLEIETVDLKALADDVARIFEQKARDKGLRLRVESNGEVPPMEADSFKLEQVFINLLDNAIKYTEEGEVVVSLAQEDGRIVITVTDTGIGIPQEDQSRIFERFYVVDKSRSRKLGGTGLGLSIVKHIVLAHNGTIDVQSAVGKGTRFTITLPISHS
jgi:two-component system phosphate regulon sensor histidine kinase PhoR